MREGSVVQRRMRRPGGLAGAIWGLTRSAGFSVLGRRLASCWPFPVLVTVQNGRQMYVDLRSSIGRGLFATGTFDIEAIKPALEVLTPGATFVDIGANIGFYSLLALDRVRPDGKVYCFEIDPRPLRALRKTVRTLAAENLEIEEMAVADTDGAVTFVPATDHGHNRIVRNGVAGTTVRSVRLDTWATQRGLTRVDVIKIDVEGAEKFVLEGARETIGRFKPFIVCEAAQGLAGEFGYRPDELVALLRDLDYSVTWLDGVHTPTFVARARRGP